MVAMSANSGLKMRREARVAIMALVIVSLVSGGNVAFGNARELDDNPHTPAILPSAPAGPQEFSPAGEEFTAWFPAEPIMTAGKRFFGERQRDYQFHFYTIFTGDTLFMVESYEGDKPQELVRITMSSRRRISGRAGIELNGYKGTEFTQEVEGLAFKGRYFATKKHLYIVETAKRGDYDPAMDQFLNSFRLERSGESLPTIAASNVPDNGSTEEVFESRQVPTKAIILFKLPATYTDAARARSIRGTVVLQAVLRASGEVSDIQVRSGLPYGLTEQSIEATKAIVFVPAMKDNQPVSQRIIVEYSFNIF